MNTTKSTQIYTTNNGTRLAIKQTREKFANVDLWRVCIERGGVWYVLRDNLKNKPTKRQINRYLLEY